MSAVGKPNRPGRRSRIPLSCEPCRTRKLKCNRELPCQNCTTRDEQSHCRYRGQKHGHPSVARPAEQDSMQQRIDRLESLVKRLISQGQEASPPVSGRDSPKPVAGSVDTADFTDSADLSCGGTTVIDDMHSVYKSSDDWCDVLQEINDLKKAWSMAQDDQTDLQPPLSNTVDGSGLLFGQVRQTDLVEILGSVPPKPEVDDLLRQFFDYGSFPITVPPIVHQPTFMREYAEHWRDPSQTSVIWLGLLFSILGITMLSYSRFGEPPMYEGISESLFQLYRLRTAQCLIMGDISKCLPYTLETLRFNATAELNRRDDSGRGLWIMTGVIVRAAINMGYHRDPAPFLPLLQAEYRRRVWYSVSGMDDMASFLVGFPRMMPAIYSDTREPRNLHDWELSEESTALPPSRPLTDPTPTTYMIVKGRLFRALGRTVDLNNSLGLSSYETVLEVDRCLHEAYQNFPPHMLVDSSKFSRGLETRVDFSNLQLGSMYHQGMCILHRKYITRGRLEARFSLSRERCMSSALALLDYQRLLQPKWYSFSQTRKMLTLASMILFLELEHRRHGLDTDVPSSASLLQALEKSCALWAEAKDVCDEAEKVYEIVSRMLSSFHTSAPPDAFGFPGFSTSLEPDAAGLEKNLLDIPDLDLDWATWDAFIEGAGAGEQT